MTTDELVKAIIRDYNDITVDPDDFNELYDQHMRLCNGSDVHSVALNDETRDIRYVRLGVDAYEVTPEQRIATVYVKV